jgi:hypothetical protein
MSAKTLFAAVVLAGLSLGLGAGSPTHAAGDDELTLAREYWRLDALFGGHAVPEQDELGNAARIKFCSETRRRPDAARQAANMRNLPRLESGAQT